MDKLPVIPRCKVIKKLGCGGMASVYLGVQENLGREVAIKVMVPALFMDGSFTKRFVKEAKIAARLVHPNIITVHDVGRRKDFYYIIMEYLEESLHDRIKRMGVLTPEEALGIIKKLAGALEYAHSKGIIHRDIKSDNIMFRFDNTPILVDFGIARVVDSNTKLTQSGMNIGTPYYMSPEQCEGKKIDGRSDIYSLGIVLYEMLTGSIPYKAESPVGVIIKHIQSPVPTLPGPLSQLQPLIDKMMAKQRENRVQTGKELRKMIDSIFKSGLVPVSSTGTTPITADTPVLNYSRERLEVLANSSILRPGTGKKKWPWKAVTAVLLAVLAALVIYVSVQPPRNPDVPGNQSVTIEQYGEIMEVEKEPDRSAKKIEEKPVIVEERQKIKETIKEKAKPGTGAPPVVEKKQPPVEKKAVEPPVFRTVKLTRLSPGLLAQYKKRLKLIYVPGLPGDVKAMGQITLSLAIDGKGNPRIRDFEDIDLIVKPAEEKDRVKKLISEKINSLSFVPPKDKEGFPVNLEKWRITFKVAYFETKIILTKL